jgi:iron uptake system component EfeO
VAALLLVPLACGDDDDAATTATASGTASTAAPTEPADTTGETGETSTGEAAPPALPSDPAAAKAVVAYRQYLRKRAGVMAAEAPLFAKALRQGTPARAQAIYPRLISAYESIRPALVDLGYADRLGAAEGEAEGDWTGLHAIEKILFDTGTTVGTEQLGATFVDDVAALQRDLPGLELDPATIIGYSAALADRVPERTMTEPAEQYSRLHLYGADGNVVGSRAAYRAVRPLLAAQDEGLVASLDSSTAAAVEVLESMRAPTEFRRWDELSEGDIQAVLDAVANLQEDLADASARL